MFPLLREKVGALPVAVTTFVLGFLDALRIVWRGRTLQHVSDPLPRIAVVDEREMARLAHIQETRRCSETRSVWERLLSGRLSYVRDGVR
jgi:hypothetical protein